MAFKMAIASKLPEVSYLTVLDKYILSILAVLLLSMAVCVAQFEFDSLKVSDEAGRNTLDRALNLGLCGVWLLLHPVLRLHLNYLKNREGESRTQDHRAAGQKKEATADGCTWCCGCGLACRRRTGASARSL